MKVLGSNKSSPDPCARIEIDSKQHRSSDCSGLPCSTLAWANWVRAGSQSQSNKAGYHWLPIDFPKRGGFSLPIICKKWCLATFLDACSMIFLSSSFIFYGWSSMIFLSSSWISYGFPKNSRVDFKLEVRWGELRSRKLIASWPGIDSAWLVPWRPPSGSKRAVWPMVVTNSYGRSSNKTHQNPIDLMVNYYLFMVVTGDLFCTQRESNLELTTCRNPPKTRIRSVAFSRSFPQYFQKIRSLHWSARVSTITHNLFEIVLTPGFSSPNFGQHSWAPFPWENVLARYPQFWWQPRPTPAAKWPTGLWSGRLTFQIAGFQRHVAGTALRVTRK